MKKVSTRMKVWQTASKRRGGRLFQSAVLPAALMLLGSMAPAGALSVLPVTPAHAASCIGTPISTTADLQAISSNLSGSYCLLNNLDMTGVPFTPIGAYNGTPFSGSFDGQGHTISNLTITLSSSVGVGLFGYANGATITNVGLLREAVTGKLYVGGLVGDDQSSSISQAYGAGSVSGINEVGGLVGWQDGGSISQAYSTSSITDGTGPNGLGGLVGEQDAGSITQAYSTGSVTGGAGVAGGMVGVQNGGSVSSSFWDTTTSGQSTSAGGAGATAESDGALRTESTFTAASWDFTPGTGVWGIGSSYPYLQALGPTAATTNVVAVCDGTSNPGTLRSAIAGAAAGDTITFACSGTITVTNADGGRFIISKNLTIDGSGQAVTIEGIAQALFEVDSGTVTLNDLTLDGGVGNPAVTSNSGTLNVTNSTFSNAGTSALFNNGTLTVTNSTFSGNSAGEFGGGAIFNQGGTATVTNSTFNNNHSQQGGAILSEGGTLTVTNSTFSGNSSGHSDGGGISAESSAIVVLANTILADSSGGDCYFLQNGSGTITDNGGNLADDASCAFTQSSSKNSITTLNLGTLANNGGPTQTIALLAASAAIGAGVESVCTASPVSGLGQRGDPRGTITCDSGAYDTGDVPSQAPQTITFGALVSQSYGASPLAVSASAGSGLPVSFAAGPDPVCNASGTNGTIITLVGVGTCTVTASQAGNTAYTAAPNVVQIFSINQVPLTVTASSPSSIYGSAVPAVTAGYSGFVNGDTAASLTTAPSCGTTATSSSPAGTYATACSGAVDPNYSISYVAGTLKIQQASQTITFAAPSNRLLGSASFTVSATGGASGNTVAFTASPSTVCTASGANGATITLVGVGTCTVTANQAGNANYLAAPAVPQHFAVSYPPLYLLQTLTNSPAGPVTTGSTVTAMLTLGNHTATTQTVTLNLTLRYTGSKGSYSLTLPLTFRLSAGQTVNYAQSFTITKSFPRGSYLLSATASDKSGDTAAGSATLTVS